MSDPTAVLEPPEQEADPHHARRWLILVIIGLAQLMIVLDVTIVNIALPTAQHELGFSSDARQWVITAYALAFGSLLLLGGRVADLFGRKYAFLIGLGGFAVASAVGGAANGFEMLVIARAAQGLFGALLAPAALSLLTTTFTEPKERAKAFGIFGAIAGSGAAVGLVLGGLLTEYLDWRWTLYVNDAIAVPALIGAIVFIGRSLPAERPKLDILGVVLVSGGLFGIVYGFANAETHDWDNWMTWGFLAGGAVLLVAFFLWQTRAEHPVLPLRVLADRDRAAALSTILISSAGMFGVFLFLTYYLQSTLGYSPVKNGVAFLPMVGALMVLAQISTNWLVPKIGPKIVVPTGMLLALGGMIWLTRLDLDSSYAAHVLGPLLLLGAGLGMSMPAAMSYATLGVDAGDQGVASAALNTTQQVGGSISTALLNTLAATAATNYAKDHLSDPLVKANAALHSYEVAYWWSAGFFAFAAVVTALLFRAKRKASAPAEQAETQVEAPAPDGPVAVAAVRMDAAVLRGQVRNGTGVPVPRTAITLLDTSGRQLARALSREDGTYAVETAERGSLVLIGSAPGYQPQVVTLTLSGAPVSHDLVILPSPGGLAGTVRGGDGEVLPGALVVATDQRGDVTASTSTAADGGYRIGDLLPGDYTLSVSAPGHRPAAVPATVTADTARCDIELVVAATLRGTVHTPDGRALDDARVSLIDAAGNVVGTRTTSVDGSYAFTDLSSEQYTVIASGYPPVATQVTLNGSQEGVDIQLGHKEA